MQVAIISDIHGNLAALEAVLAEIGSRDPEQVWCLGDIVGCGAEPDQCVAMVSEFSERCLVGNHDLVVRGDVEFGRLPMDARIAARWTADKITGETRELLERLHPSDEAEGVGLFHASPRDPIWESVLSIDQARNCLDAQGTRISLVGHSHVACCFSRQGGAATAGILAPTDQPLDVSSGDWLVNPGSVGQPRDGDPRAAYAMLDTAAWTVSYHRVTYAIEKAARAIQDANLPRWLAQRLYLGQ